MNAELVLKTFERVLCEELTRKLYRYGGWILLLIGLFISAFAFGQISDRKGRPVQTIRGMVVDGDSKYPIPYATVRLSDKEGWGRQPTVWDVSPFRRFPSGDIR